MKRVKAACITQTICFSNHDGETTEFARKMIVREYEKYKEQLEKSGTKYKEDKEEGGFQTENSTKSA